MKDGETIVAMVSLDDRVLRRSSPAVDEKKPDDAPKLHGLAVTSDGYALRFGLEPFLEASDARGPQIRAASRRRGSQSAAVIDGDETVIAASKKRRALLCKADEINFLAGAGKGVLLIKLDDDDRLLGGSTPRDDRDTLTVKTSMGGEQRINTGRYEMTGRGGKGHEFVSARADRAK